MSIQIANVADVVVGGVVIIIMIFHNGVILHCKKTSDRDVGLDCETSQHVQSSV